MTSSEIKSVSASQRAKAVRPDTSFVWECTRAIILEYFKIFHRVRYRGQRNIPAEGPLIIAPNHVSFYDPPLVAAGVPHRMRFMAWDALFRVPFLKQLISAYGAFPVRAKSADKSAVTATLSILRNRECMMIFPEGGRSKDGQLKSFEQGLARMAVKAGARIVPVAVTGAFESWPCQHLLPRWFHRIMVKYYPAINIPPGNNHNNEKQRANLVNQLIASSIERRMRASARLRKMNDRRKAR